MRKGEWRDDTVIKSTGYFSRGIELNSQQPRGRLQPSVNGPNAFLCVETATVHSYTHKRKTSQNSQANGSNSELSF